MKKFSLMILVLILSVVSASCSSNNNTASNTPAVHETNGQTKIVQFWYSTSGTDSKAVTKLVDEYNNSQSAVHVNATFVPPGQRLQKLTAAIGAGSPPELFTAGPPDLATLLGTNSLTPIDDLDKGNKNRIEASQYYDVMQKLIVAKGKTWAVPVETGVMGLYYNADLFKQAGIAGPPATWDEFVQDAQKLTNPAKGQYGILLPTATDQFTGQSWLQFLYQAGGQMLSDDLTKAAFNSPAGVKALQLWVDLISKYKAAPLQVLNNTSIPQTFGAGKSGMFFAHPSWIELSKQFPFKTLTARLPGDVKHASTLGGWYIVVPSKSTNKDAAYDFLTWVHNPKNNVKWNIGIGSLPTNKATADTNEYQQYLKKSPLVKPFADSLVSDAIVPQPTKYFSQITVILAKVINEALYQKESPKAALDKAAEQVNKLLQTK